MAVHNRVGSGWWGGGRDDGRDVAFWREREIKRLWRMACERSPLAQWIPTPTGWTVSIPRIGRVTLGAPTSITVQLLTGQVLSDVAAVAPWIAQIMGAGALRVSPMCTPTWVRVEFLDRGELDGGQPGHDEPGGGVVTPLPTPWAA
jgi:hypothetical protein